MVLAALLAAVALAFASASPGVSAEGVEEEALSIAKALRCPICQGLSVADSTSELAQQMRRIIRDKLAQGESREAIIVYFVERYGEEILLAPPARGLGLLAWLVPLGALVAGAAVAGLALRRWLRRSPSPAEEDGLALPLEETADDPETLRILERWQRGLL